MMTIQQALGLVAGLVATTLTFLTGFDQASTEVDVPALVYLGLGLVNALLAFAVLYLSSPAQQAKTLLKNSTATTLALLDLGYQIRPPESGAMAGLVPPARPGLGTGGAH